MIIRSLLIIAVAAIGLTSPLSAQTSSMMPKAIIGSHTRVIVSVKDLLQSMAWWTKFGFSPLSRPEDKIDSAITLSDGQVIITLVKTNQPSPVIVYRCDNIKRLKAQLDSLTILTTFDLEGPSYKELRLRSPNSVYLAVRPSTMEDDFKATGALNPVCGNLTEYSTSATKLRDEQSWWADLGFAPVRGDSVPYPYVNMGDERIEIGIHEDRDIASLALTYFMPDMEQRIARIKQLGLTPIEEIPTADNRIGNAIFQSPDGQLVYLFDGKQ